MAQVCGNGADLGDVGAGPRTAEAIGQAANLLARLDAPGAAGVLTLALGRDPENVDAWLLLAQVRLALDDPGGALDAAGSAGRLAPADDRPPALSSRALTLLGRHEEAVAAAYRAAAAEPDNPYRHNRVAWALLADRTRPAEAEQAARVAVGLASDVAAFHLTYGTALQQLGNVDGARHAVRHALRLEPDNAAAGQRLAELDAASALAVDRSLRGFLARTAYLILGLALAGYLLDEAPIGGVAVRAAVVAALAVPAALAFRFVRRLSAPARAELTVLATTAPLLRATAGAALSAALLPVAAFGPGPWRHPMLVAAALGGLFVRFAAGPARRSVAPGAADDRAGRLALAYVLGSVTVCVLSLLAALLALVGWTAGLPGGAQVFLGATVIAVTAAGAGAVIVRRRRAAPPAAHRR